MLLVAILSGSAVSRAERTGTDGDGGSAGSGCVVPSDEALHAAEDPTPDGTFPHEQWIVNDDAQIAVEVIDSAIESEFGDPDRDAKADPLAAGLIGVTLDHYAKSVVVVVDPTLVQASDLEERLEELVQAFIPAEVTPPAIRVTAGCHAAADLIAARAVIEKRAWHVGAARATYDYYLDAFTSTFKVTFGEDDRDVAAALGAALTDKVTIEFGTPSRATRLNDGEPHHGGAGIGQPQGNNFCTSGFTVRLPSDELGSVSAGHCFNDGQNVWSGDEVYGVTGGESGFPTFDMIRIDQGAALEDFAKKIWVDPCCPMIRTVVDSGNPSLGSFVCASGMVTRAVCGLEVINTDAELCDPAGCTPNLFKANQPGETVVHFGDSGAPVYNRFGSDNAAVRGMLIGFADRDNILAHKVSTIRVHLSVTVARD